MKLAVFGATGQVATEVQRRVPNGVTLEIHDRTHVDFLEPWRVNSAVEAMSVDAILNAVAYTSVDRAEEDAERAHLVNGTAVRHLAEAAAAKRIPVVHISTDYVFPGTGTAAWKPDDPTSPLGVYGASKLAGETALRQSGTHHAILRTSWVFSAHGHNFVKTMLRLGAERDRLTVVADQIGGPTPAADIADACFTLAQALKDGHQGGTYHFSGEPDVSWANFAREVFAQTGLKPVVADILTENYPTPAKRPLNSRLDCSTLKADFGIRRPDWRVGLGNVLHDLKS